MRLLVKGLLNLSVKLNDLAKFLCSHKWEPVVFCRHRTYLCPMCDKVSDDRV